MSDVLQVVPAYHMAPDAGWDLLCSKARYIFFSCESKASTTESRVAVLCLFRVLLPSEQAHPSSCTMLNQQTFFQNLLYMLKGSSEVETWQKTQLHL